MRRRQFIRLAGVAASAPILYAIPAAHLKAAPVVSVRDYGAQGDGVSDDTQAITNALHQNPSATVVVPPGDYLMRNPVYVRNFSGRMQCEAGARFLYLDGNRPGWTFIGGTGAVLSGFRAGWQEPGRWRLGTSAGLLLDRTVHTWVDRCVIENSNGAGVNCWVCDYPKVTNSSAFNTLANGFFIGNCKGAVLVGLRSENTGDDGLEICNYAELPNNNGAYARSITVINSRSRGISVTGQSNVDVQDFTVNKTASSGILVVQDRNFNNPVPVNVRFANGVVTDAGTNDPVWGNQFGVEVHDADKVIVMNVQVIGSRDRGVSVYAPAGTVTLRDISVSRPAKGVGANLSAKALNVEMLRTSDTPGYGIIMHQCGTVSARGLEAINASLASDMRRAIWLENNGHVNVVHLQVTDRQPTPTGDVVGAYGPQTGTINGILGDITNSQVRTDFKGSPGLVVVR